MTVGELIEILEGFDPEAAVYILEQPQWPFEYSIKGVLARNDFTEVDPEAANYASEDRWSAREDSLPGSDVFILEGSQLRYGNSKAWDAAER